MLAIYINDYDGLFVGSRVLYNIEGTEPDLIADYLEREFGARPSRILVIENDTVKYDYESGTDFEE